MVNFTLLAGGATSFIATYLFNSDAGTLSLVRQTPSNNPVWITPHPTNATVLYALNEDKVGGLQSYTVQNGVVSPPVDTVPSGGDTPAHVLALSTGEVSVANFFGPGIRIVPTARNSPVDLLDNATLVDFPSNPHQTYELRPGKILVPDLGADKVFELTRAKNGSWSITGSIDQPSGSGPRHVQVVDNFLVTIHEAANTVTTQNLLAPNRSVVLSTVSTLPSNRTANSTWGAAELLIPPPSKKFPNTYVYASNRNNSPDEKDVDPAGDTIAIFSLSKRGELKLVNTVWTGIRQPRGVAFSGSPYSRPTTINGEGTAEYVAVGGQGGTGGVAIFRRTEGGKNLKLVARETTIATRTSFVWV